MAHGLAEKLQSSPAARLTEPTHPYWSQKMSSQQNTAIAQKFLEGVGDGRDPVEIANLFDADLVFEIQGDDGVLPWIGHKTGRQAVVDFIRDIRALTEPVAFNVEDILASDSRAAIVGALQTRIKATGKIIATQFAIVLTITGDVVTRFQMLEDSFNVSKAART
jgi:ketosteroid isomerase-like protein